VHPCTPRHLDILSGINEHFIVPRKINNIGGYEHFCNTAMASAVVFSNLLKPAPLGKGHTATIPHHQVVQHPNLY
jgi:hypothetical protein